MMDNPVGIRLILLGFLLLLSAFFSASEAAFFSLHGVNFENLRKKNAKKGHLIRSLLDEPRRLLVTIYLGNEIVNVSIAAVTTSLMLHIMGDGAVLTAMVLSLLLLIFFGEIIPKTYAIRNPEKVSLFASKPLNWFSVTVAPFQYLITIFTDFIVSSVGVRTLSKEPTVSEEEIRTLINMGEERGDLPTEEKEMIQSVFELGETAVSEVMTPRTDILAFDVSTSLDHILEKVEEVHHSRVPVYDKNIDQIQGILYRKDLMRYVGGKKDKPEFRKLLHNPFMIPATKKINELLKDFQRKKVHLAIVLDEHGGVEGLVTLEDLLGELFGEIEEESRKDIQHVTPIDERKFRISAKMGINDFNEEFKTSIPNVDFDTVGGFVFHCIGRVPKRGESVDFEHLNFTIEKMERNRIATLRMHVSDRVVKEEDTLVKEENGAL